MIRNLDCLYEFFFSFRFFFVPAAVNGIIKVYPLPSFCYSVQQINVPKFSSFKFYETHTHNAKNHNLKTEFEFGQSVT